MSNFQNLAIIEHAAETVDRIADRVAELTASGDLEALAAYIKRLEDAE